MCCVAWCLAVCCTVLQCVISVNMCCLQQAAAVGSTYVYVLECVAVCCSVLLCVAV